MRRSVIGVVLPTVDQYYQRDLLEGISEMAEELEYDIFYFCGGQLGLQDGNDVYNNAIYQLIQTDDLVGLIFVSGTLTNHCGKDVFDNFLGLFRDIPSVHLTYEDETKNCIFVDNYKSMVKVIDHLFIDHDYNRYAFISGPESNSEAIRRKEAFLDCMKEQKIDKENYRVYSGDFSKESAHGAFREIVKENWKPDVILCANDEMAIGVSESMSVMDDMSWRHIPFTGFDNIDNATTFSPSFTTLEQPLFDMGKSAVSALTLLIEGKLKKISLPHSGQLKVRESCGCNHFKNILGRLPVITSSNENITNNLLNTLYGLDGLAGRKTSQAYSFHELITFLLEELNQEKEPGYFLGYLQKYYSNEVLRPVIEDQMATVKETLISTYGMLPSYVLEIFIQFEKIKASQGIKDLRMSNYDFNTVFYYSSEMIRALIGVTDTESVFKVIKEYISGYDFNHFYVCLFEEVLFNELDRAFVYPEKTELRFGYQNGEWIEPFAFETKVMIPQALISHEKAESYIIYPLNYRSSFFGYIICDLEATASPFLDILRREIANTLERLYIQQELDRYNQYLSELSIRDSLTELYNRRGMRDYFSEISSEGKEFGIIVGDMNNLKVINDSYGHNEGDVAIRAIGNILNTSIDGRVGRVGGDEFMCLLNPLGEQDMHQVLDEIQKKIKLYNEHADKDYDISIAIGYSYWTIGQFESLDQALDVADAMLYKHKKRYKETGEWRF